MQTETTRLVEQSSTAIVLLVNGIGAMPTNLGCPRMNPYDAMLALPAIFGALIVFPMAAIAKDHFGKGAGVIAAWLIAFMPTHVQKSTRAMADHDSYVLLS